MGIVVLLRTNGRIYLATDVSKERSDLIWRTKSDFNLKIHKLKNGIMVGAIGPLRQTQKLYMNESWFTPPKGVPFDKKFLVTNLIPKYINKLCKMGALEEVKEPDEAYPRIAGEFIIVNGDDAFIINGDLGVYTVKDFAIITDLDDYDKYVYSAVASVDRSEPERFFRELFQIMSEGLKEVVPDIAVIDTVNTEFRYYGGPVSPLLNY